MIYYIKMSSDLSRFMAFDICKYWNLWLYGLRQSGIYTFRKFYIHLKIKIILNTANRIYLL